MDTTVLNNNHGKSFLDGIVYLIYQIFVFLLPIFFIPSVQVAFQSSRMAFIMVGTLLVFLVWIIARLKDGSFTLPKSLFYASCIVPVVVYIASALLSGNRAVSIVGYNFELGTLSLFLTAFLVFVITPLVVDGEMQIRRIFRIVLASFIVVALYSIAKVFIADFPSFGVLIGNTANLIGKWNDLAIYSGFIAILSAIILDRGPKNDKNLRIMAWVSVALAMLLLIVVNFSAVWITLFFAALIMFVYSVSSSWMRRTDGALVYQNVPTVALIVLIISALFMLVGRPSDDPNKKSVGNVIAEVLNVVNIEARPSWQLTSDITKEALSDDPFFGVGPNRFTNVWLPNKPTDINGTIFWNFDFNYGIGHIPTLVATTGILGILGFLFFLCLFFYSSGRALFAIAGDSPTHYSVLASFSVATFLWVFFVIYVPSPTLFVLALLFTGLTVASTIASGVVPTFRMSAAESHLKSFLVVLMSVLALIGTIFFVYKVGIKTFANISFQKGVVTVNNGGDLVLGEKYITRAVSLYPNDVYYRFLSDLYLARLGNTIGNTTLLESELQAEFQNLLGLSIGSAQSAIAYDITNYQNHVALGRVYEAIVPLGITGSYESSKASYETALSLNPESPELYLLLARLEVAKGDTKAARENINLALEKKSNYADAVFFLTQIEASEGRLAEATRAAENLAVLSPNDAGVFFQLGFFHFRGGNYVRAVQALERAVSLSGVYANAKYFLGLSYYETGNKEGAIKQFSDLTVSNPDNEEIKTILVNLKDGKAPFSGSADTRPERRQNPPIEETSASREEL